MCLQPTVFEWSELAAVVLNNGNLDMQCLVLMMLSAGDLPEPSANQQAVLVHMLYLAHQFDVTDCRTACLNVLMQCQQMQPAALGLAFQLLSPLATRAGASVSTAEGSAHAGEPPTRAAGCEGFKALLIHCQDQLQQQLGDMEVVLGSPSQLANLHSLPLPALLALLQDQRTSAASENTVLAAVHSWMTAAAQRDVRVDAAQREQLAAAVRVPLLEPCFLATVLPRMAWLTEILGPQGLATAAAVARGHCDPHAGEHKATNPTSRYHEQPMAVSITSLGTCPVLGKTCFLKYNLSLAVAALGQAASGHCAVASAMQSLP
jgi:hypothetical protein